MYEFYCREPMFDNCLSEHGGKQLYRSVDSSQEFCELMGYPVTSSDVCWDGVPLAQKVQISRRGSGHL